MDDKQSSIDNKNQIKKCVSDLYKACEEGNHAEIKKLVNEQLYSYSKLDIALRKLLFRIDIENEAYLESLQLILKVFNINYQNQNDKSTIIMEICGKGYVFLIKFILNATFDDKLIEEIIDFGLYDNANCNFIHYIFYRNTNEDDAIDILRYFFEKYKDNLEQIKLFSKQLESKDKGGNTPISIILSKGWYQMLKVYFAYIPFKPGVIDGNNNLIHCVVSGKSLGCLKLILFNSKIEDLKFKNKEGITPLQYANRKGYHFFVKIMENYELNYMNVKYRKYFLDNGNSNSIGPNSILDLFLKEEYEDVESMLGQYKLNQTINPDIIYLPIDWNILLVKFKSRLKNKKMNKKVDNYKNDYYDSFLTFFNSYLTDAMIETHNEEDSGPIDILIYNKGFLYYISGDLVTSIRVYSLYLTYILKQNDTAYYKWIIYVNISFILIEIFFSYNQLTICHIIIDKIEEFLFTSYRLRNEAFYFSDVIDKIYEFLNRSEIFHRFTPSWDESFCYLILLKIMTNYPNKANQFISEYKKRIKNCSYRSELKVFQRMELTYNSLKIKKNYFQNNTKCLKKLNLFKQEISSGENQFFYYNSLGILNLKLKNYVYAEYLLISGINCFEKLFYENNKYSDFKTKKEYLCKLKFNLALSLFFQRKFNKSRVIWIQLTQMKIFQKNVFVWYRLGLCSLEIDLLGRVDKTSWSGIIKDIHVYNNSEKEKEHDCISIDLKEDNSDNLDELYLQFEREYGCNSRKDSNADFNNQKQEFKRFILHSNPAKRKPPSIHLIESIKAFKQVLLLSKTNITNYKEVKDIIIFYSKNNGNTQIKSNPYVERGTAQTIVISTYYNLLFALSLKEDWTEMLFIIREFYSNKNIKSSLSNDIRLKIEHFQIEAMIHLNREKEALDIIQKHLDTYQNDNYRFDYYCKGINMFHSDISFKLNFHISLTIIHIRANRLQEAETCLQTIFKNFIKDKKNIPPYLISLLIYFNIVQGRRKVSNVLTLLKNRKMANTS